MLSAICQTNLPAPLLKAFIDEVEMLASLRHPNICLYMAACIEPPNRAIVTELVSRGSLWEVLRTPSLFEVLTLYHMVLFYVMLCYLLRFLSYFFILRLILTLYCHLIHFSFLLSSHFYPHPIFSCLIIILTQILLPLPFRLLIKLTLILLTGLPGSYTGPSVTARPRHT